MKKLPTAEEFLMNRGCSYYKTPGATIFEVKFFDMIDFAKMHVHEALEVAYQKGMLKVISNEEYREDEDLIEEYECGCDTIILHKASILNAYPDELIK